MRNRFGGPCYRCGEWVEPRDGHFQRRGSQWLTQHADCAIMYRGTNIGKTASLFPHENRQMTIGAVTIHKVKHGSVINGHQVFPNKPLVRGSVIFVTPDDYDRIQREVTAIAPVPNLGYNHQRSRRLL